MLCEWTSSFSWSDSCVKDVLSSKNCGSRVLVFLFLWRLFLSGFRVVCNSFCLFLHVSQLVELKPYRRLLSSTSVDTELSKSYAWLISLQLNGISLISLLILKHEYWMYFLASLWMSAVYLNRREHRVSQTSFSHSACQGRDLSNTKNVFRIRFDIIPLDYLFGTIFCLYQKSLCMRWLFLQVEFLGCVTVNSQRGRNINWSPFKTPHESDNFRTCGAKNLYWSEFRRFHF